MLGLGSYQTAWTMLHRFPRPMVRPGREQLKGLAEVDETYLAITDRQEPISPVGRKSSTTKVLVVATDPASRARVRASQAFTGALPVGLHHRWCRGEADFGVHRRGRPGLAHIPGARATAVG